MINKVSNYLSLDILHGTYSFGNSILFSLELAFCVQRILYLPYNTNHKNICISIKDTT